MTAFLIVLHVFVCLFLILFVLLQPGARGGVGAAFGGAGGQTVFGGRGANTFLAKLTAAAAVVFMVTSISLSYFVSHSSSLMKSRAAAPKKDETPAAAPADSAPTGSAPADDSAESGAGSAPVEGTVPAAAPAAAGDAAAAPEAPKPAADAQPAP